MVHNRISTYILFSRADFDDHEIIYYTKAKLFLEATKTRPHFSLPEVIIQVQTSLEYSTG